MDVDPTKLIVVEQHGPVAAHVTVWLADGVRREDPAVVALLQEAEGLLAPGMSFGPIAPPGPETPLFGYTFGVEHVPEPLEDILDWLREQRIIRLIEVERHTVWQGPAA